MGKTKKGIDQIICELVQGLSNLKPAVAWIDDLQIPHLPPKHSVEDLNLPAEWTRPLREAGWGTANKPHKAVSIGDYHNNDSSLGPSKLAKVLVAICQLRRQQAVVEDPSQEISAGKAVVAEILAIPGAHKISRFDTRFRKELRRIHESIHTAGDLKSFIGHPVFCLRVQAIRGLRDKILSATSVTIEQELLQILTRTKELDLRRKIVVSRLGFYGHESQTLESIGDELGFTRERVRQMTCTRLMLRSDKVYSPNSGRGLKVVEESLPILGSQLQKKLVDLKLIDRTTSAMSLERVAGALEIRTKWRVVPFEGDCLFLLARDLKLLERSIKAAVGAMKGPDVSFKVTMPTFQSIITKRLAMEVPVQCAEVIVKQARVKLIGHGSLGFALELRKSKFLVKNLQKILCFCPKLSTARFVALLGKRRPYSQDMWSHIELTDADMEPIFDQWPIAKIEGGQIVAIETPKMRNHFGGSEAKIVRFLMEKGGVTTFDELKAYSKRSKISIHSLAAVLQHCMVIERKASRVWGLIE